MIIIALGANMPSVEFGSPRQILEAALDRMARRSITILTRSKWYRSQPVPASGQPDYINGVVGVSTTLAPAALLALLHEIEREFGRVRRKVNEARVLDLDIIDFHGLIAGSADKPPILPHPRMHDRAFVLLPLRDASPQWCHPIFRKSVGTLISEMGIQSGIVVL